MTSHKGAGYSGGRKPAAESLGNYTLEEEKSEEARREDEVRELVSRIHDLTDSVAARLGKGEFSEALSEAREAEKCDISLLALRESDEETHSEIGASVLLALALAVEKNGMEAEAMETYTKLIGNKRYGDASRFRINLGNLYFKKEEYTKAIKMYKMALDKMPETQRNWKYQVMKNIAVALLKVGRLKQAVEQYERLVENGAMDTQVLGDLMLCYGKLGDVEQMQKLFHKALTAFHHQTSSSPPHAAPRSGPKKNHQQINQLPSGFMRP